MKPFAFQVLYVVSDTFIWHRPSLGRTGWKDSSAQRAMDFVPIRATFTSHTSKASQSSASSLYLQKEMQHFKKQYLHKLDVLPGLASKKMRKTQGDLHAQLLSFLSTQRWQYVPLTTSFMWIHSWTPTTQTQSTVYLLKLFLHDPKGKTRELGFHPKIEHTSRGLFVWTKACGIVYEIYSK